MVQDSASYLALEIAEKSLQLATLKSEHAQLLSEYEALLAEVTQPSEKGEGSS